MNHVIKSSLPSPPIHVWELSPDPDGGTPYLTIDGNCVLCISKDEKIVYIGNKECWSRFGLTTREG